MTEAEWLGWGSDPSSMLDVVRDQVGGRKLRLFACACGRRVWHLLDDGRCRGAVEAGELFADGRLDARRLADAKAAANAAHFEAAAPDWTGQAAHAAACAFFAATDSAISTFAAANRAASCVGQRKESEQREQCRLFRDIIGNPFRPASLAPAWLTADARSLAQAAYDERSLPLGHLDAARLAVLSDALEEAGCTDDAILSHLRSPGPHARGCWALDFVLVKE